MNTYIYVYASIQYVLSQTLKFNVLVKYNKTHTKIEVKRDKIDFKYVEMEDVPCFIRISERDVNSNAHEHTRRFSDV